MTVAFSSDGLHWAKPILIPEIEAHGTHPSAFWAPDLRRYVGFTRQHDGGLRLVTRAESPDFVHWTEDELVLASPSSRLQIHDMLVFPTNGAYIGLLGGFVIALKTRSLVYYLYSDYTHLARFSMHI